MNGGNETVNTNRGLIIIITGDGKGKTTSALGMMLRAWGQDMKTAMLQFVKSSDSDCGEHRALKRLGLEIVTMGAGFIWVAQNFEKNRVLTVELWSLARKKINSGNYDMLILDEFTYALKFGWLSVPEVLAVFQNRPPRLHIVITGRDAPQELIDIADTVSEIRQIKHHFGQGVKAQKGIEF